MTNKVLQVKGMHCSSCEMLLRDAIGEIKGAKVVSIDHRTGRLSVDFDSEATLGKVKQAIKAEGYEVV